MRTGDRGAAPLAELRWATAMGKRSQRAIDRHIEWVDVDEHAALATLGSAAHWVVFVERGALVSSDDEGTRVLGPGSVVGAVEALHNATYTSTLRPTGGARVGLIDRRRFVGLLATVPEFAAAILRHVTGPEADGARAASRRRGHLRLVSSAL